MIMTTQFWKSAGEAAIKAAAAAALAVIGTDQFLSATSVEWSQVGGIALLAGIVSILTSVVVPTPEVRAAKRETVRAAEAKAVAEKLAAEKAAAAKPARKPVRKATKK